MISVIISSANNELLNSVKQNIADTIGVPYEVIAFDNSSGNYGICAVYNKGIQKAQYNLLCFMHEDVEMQTQNWGQVVEQAFKKNNKLGVLGVAGCSYKSVVPSGWVNYGNGAILHYHYIQQFKHTTQPDLLHYSNPSEVKAQTQVACLDGVWLCTTKEIALHTKFDETLLTGFHGYDVDYCLSVSKQFEVAVTYQVLLKHFSEGQFKKDWAEACIKLYYKWKDQLPANVAELNNKQQATVELKTAKAFINKMVDFGFNSIEISQIINETGSKIGLKLWIKLYFHYLKQRNKRIHLYDLFL